jgi:hypothetical protein
VTIHPHADGTPHPMVHPFPTPGSRVQLAYRELNIAINGTKEQQQRLGRIDQLPRPWIPGSCQDPDLRRELWQWLEDVVAWLNREYTWAVEGMIPTCWPSHPHLVNEIAVVADQRRRSGLALTSDAIEEWHRYCLPYFADRLRHRLKSHCDDDHTNWPGRPRHHQHISEPDREDRANTYTDDVATLRRQPHAASAPARRLELVDIDTGEIDPDHD